MAQKTKNPSKQVNQRTRKDGKDLQLVLAER